MPLDKYPLEDHHLLSFGIVSVGIIIWKDHLNDFSFSTKYLCKVNILYLFKAKQLEQITTNMRMYLY